MAAELRRVDVLAEKIEQGTAFRVRQALDPRREDGVHEQRLAAGHRMGADDRVQGLRIDVFAVAHFAGSLVAPEIAVPALMLRLEGAEERLHRLRKRVIGGVGAREHGVAANIRRLLDMQNATERRFGITAYIAVPTLTCHAL